MFSLYFYAIHYICPFLTCAKFEFELVLLCINSPSHLLRLFLYLDSAFYMYIIVSSVSPHPQSVTYLRLSLL